jgi:PHD-finger
MQEMEVDEDETLYCLCKRKQGNKFMIACDICNDWFHGICVGVTKAMAKDDWCCQKCKITPVKTPNKTRDKCSNCKISTKIYICESYEIQKCKPCIEQQRNRKTLKGGTFTCMQCVRKLYLRNKEDKNLISLTEQVEQSNLTMGPKTSAVLGAYHNKMLNIHDTRAQSIQLHNLTKQKVLLKHAFHTNYTKGAEEDVVI